MAETSVTGDEVEREHLAEIHQSAHWAYMFGVILGGLILMLLLIAFLGSTSV